MQLLEARIYVLKKFHVIFLAFDKPVYMHVIYFRAYVSVSNYKYDLIIYITSFISLLGNILLY